MSPLAVCAALVFGGMSVLWLISLPLRNASIVDTAWGLGFVLIAVAAAWTETPLDPARWLVLAMVSIWGVRLAAYIGWRNRGHGEDFRYAEMRRSHGPAFAWKSLYIVFGFQALLMLVISAPLQAALADSRGGIEPLQWLGVGLWLIGFLFETVGDWQLTRFKSDPANRGKVLDRGLWRYTRHPNYFGDAVVWWGLYIASVAIGAPWWTVFGPALMTFLVMRVSGVTLLERTLEKTKPAYADYVERTSAFFPLPPRKS